MRTPWSIATIIVAGIAAAVAISNGDPMRRDTGSRRTSATRVKFRFDGHPAARFLIKDQS